MKRQEYDEIFEEIVDELKLNIPINPEFKKKLFEVLKPSFETIDDNQEKFIRETNFLDLLDQEDLSEKEVKKIIVRTFLRDLVNIVNQISQRSKISMIDSEFIIRVLMGFGDSSFFIKDYYLRVLNQNNQEIMQVNLETLAKYPDLKRKLIRLKIVDCMKIEGFSDRTVRIVFNNLSGDSSKYNIEKEEEKKFRSALFS